MLNRLVSSDKSMVEGYFNSTVLSALFRIGAIPDGLVYRFEQQEDINRLYTWTLGFMQYMDVDTEWVKEKFGVEVSGPKQTPQNAGLGFFE